MALRDRLIRAAIAFCMAAGFVLPLLGLMDTLSGAWAALGIAAGLSLLFAFATSVRRGGWIAAGLLAAALLFWILSGGAGELVQAVRALALAVSGQKDALPLFQASLIPVLAVVCSLIGWAVTSRGPASAFALALTALLAFLLWLTSNERLLVYLLPAVAASLLALAQGRNDAGIRGLLPYTAALTLLAYLLTPAGGVVSQPLKDKADALRQTIADYLFFTGPRSVFSLSVLGYYPQGTGQLGGPVHPSDQDIMTVTAPKRVYLRGAIKDTYTGRSWLDRTGGRRYLWEGRRWRTVRSSVFDENLPSGALGSAQGLLAVQTVRVQMVSGSASTLFVPQRIRRLSVGGSLVPYFNSGSEVFATRDLEPGDTWTAEAPLIAAGDAGLATLVEAAALAADPAWTETLAAYTALPDHLEPAVYDLAAEITAGSGTPYEKAMAIQRYLSRSCRYALDVALQPPELDFVTNFLFNTREGYCTYFASAMTVLCRAVGIPARYIEGYLAVPDADGIARVTGRDAHAWTEVYLSGFGWLTFDATPSVSESGSGSGGNNSRPPEPTPSPSPEPSPEPEDRQDAPDEPTPEPEDSHDSADQTDQADDPSGSEPSPPPENPDDPENEPDENEDADDPAPKPPFPWLWLLILLLLAAAAARIVLQTPARRAARAKDETGRWQAWIDALRDALAMEKLPRRTDESPLGHMKRLDAMQRFGAALTPLGESMALVYYAHVDPQPQETAQARDAYLAVWQTMKRRRKALFHLKRAFTPGKRRKAA